MVILHLALHGLKSLGIGRGKTENKMKLLESSFSLKLQRGRPVPRASVVLFPQWNVNFFAQVLCVPAGCLMGWSVPLVCDFSVNKQKSRPLGKASLEAAGILSGAALHISSGLPQPLGTMGSSFRAVGAYSWCIKVNWL